MSPDELKTQVELLLSAVVEAANSKGMELERLRGVALYNGQKDQFITSIPQFAAVESGVKELERMPKMYGVAQSHRIALQFVYEYFDRANGVVCNSAALDTLWEDFITELDTPVWITRSVTNLRYFQCKEHPVDLGDGVSILGRNPEVLASLGFEPGIVERLNADWSGFGASSFVLVAEVTDPKRPENFLTTNGSGVWLKTARAIGAMRLIAGGDIGGSVAFHQLVARFNFGIGGISSTGPTVQTMGSSYTWASAQGAAYDSTYAALARLEKIGYGKAPGNLDLALRSFMATYDRYPTAIDTKLVDSITALEAILGTDSEISFKLSYRVASLLASDDDQRAILLRTVKDFYNVRSRIVHGGHLSPKQNKSLAAVDELRDLVRRLLYSFVQFAANDKPTLSKGYFAEELDAALIHAQSRENLRKLLRLV